MAVIGRSDGNDLDVVDVHQASSTVTLDSTSIRLFIRNLRPTFGSKSKLN